MENTTRPDISELKTFTKYGDVFTQERHNPETGWWLYKRTNKEDPSRVHYEVVKGKKHKNPDGRIVYCYPSDDSWGQYGYTVDDNWFAQDMIDFLMSAENRTPQERYEFKKMLKNPRVNGTGRKLATLREF